MNGSEVPEYQVTGHALHDSRGDVPAFHAEHLSYAGLILESPAQGSRERLLVKPGLTCLWQVSGRNDLDFEEWMRMDREYVRRRGLKMDLWILLHTLPAVIARKGAY